MNPFPPDEPHQPSIALEYTTANAKEMGVFCESTKADVQRILTAANRIFDLRKDEYARQYAALKVQESGAVEALDMALGGFAGKTPRNIEVIHQGGQALRAIIADGTPQAKWCTKPMSEYYINIRVLCWHLQARGGSLTAWRVYFNGWWLNWRVILAPAAVYDFNLLDGWRSRKDGVPVAAHFD